VVASNVERNSNLGNLHRNALDKKNLNTVLSAVSTQITNSHIFHLGAEYGNGEDALPTDKWRIRNEVCVFV
jgi:hypothetical protein